MPVIDPNAPVIAVRAGEKNADKAVDWARSAEYRKSRDLSKIVLLDENVKPTRFSLRRLPATFYLRRLEGADVGLLNEMAFRAGVFAVEMPSGDVMRPAKTVPMDGVELADESWLVDCARKFGLATIYEMAALVIRLAQLSEEEAGPFGL